MELMEELSPTASVHSPWESPFFNPSTDEEDNHMHPPPQAGKEPTIKGLGGLPFCLEGGRRSEGRK